MKKALIILLTLLLAMSLLVGCGSDNDAPAGGGATGGGSGAGNTPVAEQDEVWENPTPEDAFEFANGVITKYVGSYDVVRIPQRIGGEKVEAIGAEAFKQNKAITELYLPSNVKRIEDSAFEWADGLHTVHLGQVETVGNDAFHMAQVDNLTMSPVIKTIGDSAFSLRSFAGMEDPVVEVVIPDTVTAIGERAFSSDRFKTITFLGTKLPVLGENSLGGMRGKATILVSDSYSEDEALALMSTFYAAGLSPQVTVQRMDGTALFADYSDDFDYTVMSHGTRIDAYTGSSDVIVVPATMGGQMVYAIAANAFEGNEEIRSVVLPEGLQVIYGYAFRDCINLESINIPSTVQKIDLQAFSGTTSLKSIVIPGSVEELAYAAFMESGIESLVIEEGNLKIIENMAFRECENLVSVSLPSTLKEIGTSAFSYCYNLPAIDFLPVGLEKIDDDAFYYCYSVTEIIIPEGVKYIGRTAFVMAGANQHLQDEWRTDVHFRFVLDPEAELGDTWVKDAKNRQPVMIYLPSTIEHMDFTIFRSVLVDGIVLPPGMVEVSQLEAFYNDSFYDSNFVMRIYVDSSATQAQADAIDAFMVEMEVYSDGGRTGADQGMRLYYSTEAG